MKVGGLVEDGGVGSGEVDVVVRGRRVGCLNSKAMRVPATSSSSSRSMTPGEWNE